MKSKNVVYLGTSFMTFIVIIVATIGNSWISMETKTRYASSTRALEENVEEGLWKVCFYSEINTFLHGCQSIETTTGIYKKEITSWFYTCRAFSVLACLASITGAIVFLVSFKYDFKHTRFLVSFSFVAAAIFLAITVAIYTAEFEEATEFACGASLIPNDTDYGWCYISAWIGIILSAMHGLTAFCVIKKNPYAI